MPSVLVVDDDPELLRQIGCAFLACGWQVRTAQDGAAALKALDAAPADLVVTDIIMPVREGVETIVAVKARDPAPRVIAISGGYRVGPADFLNLARHVGADEVLAKPFRHAALIAAAERLIARDKDLVAPA